MIQQHGADFGTVAGIYRPDLAGRSGDNRDHHSGLHRSPDRCVHRGSWAYIALLAAALAGHSLYRIFSRHLDLCPAILGLLRLAALGGAAQPFAGWSAGSWPERRGLWGRSRARGDQIHSARTI